MKLSEACNQIAAYRGLDFAFPGLALLEIISMCDNDFMPSFAFTGCISLSHLEKTSTFYCIVLSTSAFTVVCSGI